LREFIISKKFYVNSNLILDLIFYENRVILAQICATKTECSRISSIPKTGVSFSSIAPRLFSFSKKFIQQLMFGNNGIEEIIKEKGEDKVLY